MEIREEAMAALEWLHENVPGFRVPFKATSQDYIDLASRLKKETS